MIDSEFIIKGFHGLSFVDGPGGTGKSFLLEAILASIRRTGRIALAVAGSGIAAQLLPGGRTAHSTFRLPLDPDETITCNFGVRSSEAALLKRTSLIVWDDAPMTHRYQYEAVDHPTRHALRCELRPDSNSEGDQPVDYNSCFPLLIDTVYSDFNDGNQPDQYFSDRIILTPKNADVLAINDSILEKLPGKIKEYRSMDSLDGDDELQRQEHSDLYPPEFLNTISLSGMPPHKLCLRLAHQSCFSETST
ncbi:unnamed protein product [Phytophthora lilii]|uniref:ATP-dependent DNA helicase n=1 Tax=Phytophthora lilii TaxID=2077276 RepID=A0A9W6TTS5_9STRA|nr:unnamed protein product [Phytophthora lilii]